jgi:hypothetical protein
LALSPRPAVSGTISKPSQGEGAPLLSWALTVGQELRPTMRDAPSPPMFDSTRILIPDKLRQAPLLQAQELVQQAREWKKRFAETREPLLMGKAVQGLQRVHDEWHRESMAQKALLQQHLEAAVERLEVLEQNERRLLARMQQMDLDHQDRVRQLQRDLLSITRDLGEQVRERDAQLEALRVQLEGSEQHREALLTQIQDLRKRNTKR